MKTIRFSIIIPAYNAEATITRCLDSLAHLNYPNDEFEVIVVDDGSIDKTSLLAEGAGAEVIKKKCSSLSQVRNIGAARAKGKILLFLDSDMMVDPELLQRAHYYYFEAGFTGCLNFHDNVPESSSLIGKIWDNSGTNQNKKKRVDYLVTRNLFVPRSLHSAMGGFDEELFKDKRAGEDKEYTHRIHLHGYPLVSDSSLNMVHLGYEKGFWDFIKKEWWRQGNTLFLARKHGYPFRLLRNPILSLVHILIFSAAIVALMTGSRAVFVFFLLSWFAPSVLIISVKSGSKDLKYIVPKSLLTFIRWNVSGFALLPQFYRLMKNNGF